MQTPTQSHTSISAPLSPSHGTASSVQIHNLTSHLILFIPYVPWLLPSTLFPLRSILALRRRLDRLLSRSAPEAPAAEPIAPRLAALSLCHPTAAAPGFTAPAVPHPLHVLAEQERRVEGVGLGLGGAGGGGGGGGDDAAVGDGRAGFEEGAARPFAGARRRLGWGGAGGLLGGPARDDGVVGGGGHVVEGGVVAAAVAGEGGCDLREGGDVLVWGRCCGCGAKCMLVSEVWARGRVWVGAALE